MWAYPMARVTQHDLALEAMSQCFGTPNGFLCLSRSREFLQCFGLVAPHIVELRVQDQGSVKGCQCFFPLLKTRETNPLTVSRVRVLGIHGGHG